jgi:hypothetical protein
MKIVLARGAVRDARCFVDMPGADSADVTLASADLGDGLKVATVRLSIRQHGAGDVAGTFLCDRVLNVPKDVPSLKLPRGGAQKIDIYAEAYAPLGAGESVPRRVAVGSLLGVPLTAKTLPDLRLYPDERFRCVNQKLNRPRAFHTATALPNGEVLIVGGLTPTPDAADEAFGAAPLFVTAEAEIYDPSTGAFVPVMEDDTPAPRAFHNAVFIGTTDDGKYQVLLAGGATADPTMPAFGVNTGAAPGTRLVPFDTSVFPINPLPVSAPPTELLTYNPADRTVTRTPMVGFAPATYQAAASFADGMAVAGGLDWKGQPLSATVPAVKTIAVSRALEAPRSVADTVARMGATLTPVSEDAALLWGGQVTMPTDPAGEFVTGLANPNTVKSTTVTLTAAPPTEFHTATVLPPDSGATNRAIVVTGGFIATTMQGGQALQPPAPTMAARLLTVTVTGTVTQTAPMLSNYPLDTTCNAANPHYRPAGWESAVDLGRGRVLVSGGAPTVTGTCNDCDDGGSDFRCATSQASLFTTPSTLSPALEKLQIARYGHTSTLMRDGNVLVVGGVTAAGGAPRILRDAEMYNPRPIAPQFDATSGSPDPDDPIAADLMAQSAARAPGQPLSAQTQCGEL